MKIVKDTAQLKNKHCVIALGTFDGVHLGHRKVIESAVEAAKKNKLCCVVITFDPHPKTIVFPGRQEKLLTTIKERAALIKELGADYLLVHKFSKQLKNMSYIDFAKKILFKKLRVKHVFVGADYLFGRSREGNVSRLSRLGKQCGFRVTAVYPVRDCKISNGVKDKIKHNRIVKSSLIRGLLLHGEFSHAVKLLGHPYLISGIVVKGFRRGENMGFPTANLKVDKNKLIPRSGVYSCSVCFNSKKYIGVVNIGTCPTFGRNPVSVEVHILNFDKNIIGKKIFLYLTKRIRSEKKFLRSRDAKFCVPTLVRAIRHDIEIARKSLV